MMWLSWFKNFLGRFEQPLFILAGAAGLTALLLNLDFNLLEANLYDLRVSSGFQATPDPGIVIVTLDDRTTKALDEIAPLTLDYHVKFLNQLKLLQPRAVGYLVDFDLVHQANPEMFSGEWGTRFLEAARELKAARTPLLIGTPYPVTGEAVPPKPLNNLPYSLALVHKDGNVFAQDKITRRALTYLDEKPVFHLELAQMLGLVPADFEPRGGYAVPEAEARYFFFRYHGSTVEPSYRRISFIDVLNGSLPAGELKGKIVLVGTLSKDASSDFTFTPYSKNSFVSPKLVVHANILDSIIHNDGIVRAPAMTNWLTTFAASAFIIWCVLNTTPLYGVFASLSLSLFFLLVGQAAYQVYGLWLRGSQPLVGIFVGYYLVVPYRLIREYKKRWDYQRKNEVLLQVEELKTNFLSLVTHDLKTPVARIQGLAEVLLSKASDRLLPRDQQTLHHIIDSTDELNRFISSILELSKIESNRLKLNLESKDINTLVERAVESFKAPAKAKQIKLTANLEPLFPIKIDANLISKVINNLIDNAIKYSPAGSEVVIESREVNSYVELSIKDQGIGLSEEEIRNLFTRFYRAKNDTTTRVTGTGLGLYLTKFFIEAHQGRVEVLSEKDKGSTFKIYLALELEIDSKDGKELKIGEKAVATPTGLTRRMLGIFARSSRSEAAKSRAE